MSETNRLDRRPDSVLPVLAAIFLALFSHTAAAIPPERSAFTGPHACAADAVHIDITVDGLRSSNGLLAAVLYDDNPRNYLSRGRSVKKTRVPASRGTVKLCIDAPSPGRYALVVYHDENGNRKFDVSLFGRPREGAAFSNNPSLDGGLPEHSEAVFTVEENFGELQVTLTYP